VRKVAKQILIKVGYRVLEAADAEHALEICREPSQKIDLVLSDVVMPNMNGRELAQKLATMRPKLRVLFMSGYTGDSVLDRGILDSGVPFIQKPLTPESLARKVREVLDGS
jgi:two-component system, cell cycle sensor histidine kinase and response regulator CckA